MSKLRNRIHKELDRRKPGSGPSKAALYRLSARPLPELLGRRASYDEIAGLAYFAEYNLRNQQQCDFPALARRIAQDSVLKAVKLVTEKLGVPRIPINFAEAAGYVAFE